MRMQLKSKANENLATYSINCEKLFSRKISLKERHVYVSSRQYNEGSVLQSIFLISNYPNENQSWYK